MAFYNGVYETSTTTGTGTYTLAGAFVASGATGTAYQTFAVVGNGNQCYYRAQDNENGGWEYGIGTYTASGTTLARTQVIGSSNANAAVSWVAGTRQIFLIEPAEVLVLLNAGNTFTAGPQTVVIDADAHKGLVVQAHSATQTANLRESQDFNSVVGVSESSNRLAVGVLAQPINQMTQFNATSFNDTLPTLNTFTAAETFTDPTKRFLNNVTTFASVNPSADSTGYAANYFGAVELIYGNTHNLAGMYGSNLNVVHNGSGAVGYIIGYGMTIYVDINGTSTASNVGFAYCFSAAIDNEGAGKIGGLVACYFADSPFGIMGNNFAFYCNDQTNASADNSYAFWSDSPGVFRIKYDGVLGYYNPNFTKYTPGATAFERVVIQWDLTHNVCEIGTEKGTTGGTLRALRLIGAGVQVSATAATGPNASAAFQVDSTTQGLLPPRMTTTQKNAISSPAEGLVVHDSTLHTPWFYNGSAWTAFGGGVWPSTLTAHALYAGNGTSAPTAVGPGSTDGVPLVATGSSTDPAFRSTSLKLDSTFGVITVDADAAPVAINWATSNWHSTTLTASRQITFTGDVDGGAITIIFKSGGTGAFTPTWPATVKWLGGVAPTLTNTSSHWDIVSIKRESSGNYIGTYSLNYF